MSLLLCTNPSSFRVGDLGLPAMWVFKNVDKTKGHPDVLKFLVKTTIPTTEASAMPWATLPTWCWPSWGSFKCSLSLGTGHSCYWHCSVSPGLPHSQAHKQVHNYKPPLLLCLLIDRARGRNICYFKHCVGVHKMEAALSICSIAKYEQACVMELENRFLESMGQIPSMQEGKWSGCNSTQHSVIVWSLHNSKVCYHDENSCDVFLFLQMLRELANFKCLLCVHNCTKCHISGKTKVRKQTCSLSCPLHLSPCIKTVAVQLWKQYTNMHLRLN